MLNLEQKEIEKLLRRRRNRNSNQKKKEHQKDPNRVIRGKEIMRKIIEEVEDKVEFRIQARVELVDMANLAIGLENVGENKSLMSLSKLTQAAFKIAIAALMDKEDQLEDEEEAVYVLEKMRIIDTESSSLSGGALRRNRARASVREFHQDISQLKRRKLQSNSEEPITEVLRKAIEANPKMVEYIKEQQEAGILPQMQIPEKEVIVTQQEIQESKPPGMTPEQKAYMYEYYEKNSMTLPGIMPDPKRREGPPDFDATETQEQKMEKFQKASEETLEEQYGEEK